MPWNEPGIIGRALDAGAAGVIIPMVNSVDEAQRAASACHYWPAGTRSFGPIALGARGGFAGIEAANEQVLCIPMIETREAVEQIDAILGVPGISAVYIGPADLSITYGLRPGMDQADEEWNAAIAKVVASCAAREVIAGVHSAAPLAAKRGGQGFRMITVASDLGSVAAGFDRRPEVVTRGRRWVMPPTRSTPPSTSCWPTMPDDPVEQRGRQYDLGLAWVHHPRGPRRARRARRAASSTSPAGCRTQGSPRRPSRAGGGVTLAGPTMAVHGSDELCARLLRRAFTGEDGWCQLFSEPGAGSDMAGLGCRAVRDGDEWVVNGQKVWTTNAHLSNRAMLIARTDPGSPSTAASRTSASTSRRPASTSGRCAR